MLAYGCATASLPMLHDVLSFAQACYLHASKDGSAAASLPATEARAGQGMSRHPPGDDSQAKSSHAESQGGLMLSSALDILAVLVAHDRSCQEVVVNGLVPDEPQAQVI